MPLGGGGEAERNRPTNGRRQKRWRNMMCVNVKTMSARISRHTAPSGRAERHERWEMAGKGDRELRTEWGVMPLGRETDARK